MYFKKMELKKNWVQRRVVNSRDNLKNVYNLSNNIYSSYSDEAIKLNQGEDYLYFSSCSYLGLHSDTRIIREIQSNKDLVDMKLLFSSARTRNFSRLEAVVDKKLEQIFSPFSVVQFQNVHCVHLGVLPLLLSREFPMVEFKEGGCHCIIDKYSHQSIKSMIAIIAQFCEVTILDISNHDELLAINQKIKAKNKTLFIISDSLGSMGGVHDIRKIVKFVEKNKGYVYFDDAHSTSILGANGCGFVIDQIEEQSKARVFISTGLTKAFGSHGAVMLTPFEEQQEFIRQYATTYAFSGPISNPNLVATNVCCDIHLSDEIGILQKKLYSNVEFFDNNFNYEDINPYLGSVLPFRIVRLPSEEKLQECLSFLKQKKIIVLGATYPTVEKGKPILRISFSSSQSKDQILYLINQLKKNVGV